jgi:hypothetical protein
MKQRSALLLALTAPLLSSSMVHSADPSPADLAYCAQRSIAVNSDDAESLQAMCADSLSAFYGDLSPAARKKAIVHSQQQMARWHRQNKAKETQ